MKKIGWKVKEKSKKKWTKMEKKILSEKKSMGKMEKFFNLLINENYLFFKSLLKMVEIQQNRRDTHWSVRIIVTTEENLPSLRFIHSLGCENKSYWHF